MSTRDKYCTVYVAPDDTPLTQAEIQQGLSGPRMDDRIKALKALVKQIINDESFPRLVMPVIQNLVPIQQESHLLKKILLFYWEVIEKVNPNGNLKDEMILVCNSLRNDLLHPNEYIRGRTLKLVSRIPHRGILEPLQTAIVENVKHKNIYVRKNAVVCLYEIYLAFGDDMISDMDEMMETLLTTEQDLSTKRNAFLLLFHSNQTKALQYLDESMINTSVGDIMQIAILELFRKVCKADPTQKPKLLKSIFNFSKSKSPSVLLECANTLIAVSPSATSLKVAVGIYMQLTQTQTDNNVKLVVLERLEQLKENNPKALSESVLEIISLLGQQSLEIRKKVLSLLQALIRSEAIPQIVNGIQKEIQKIQNESDESSNEFKTMLLQALLDIIRQFPQSHEGVAQIILDHIAFSNKLDDTNGHLAYEILFNLISSQTQPTLNKITKAFTLRFYDINHPLMFKSGLFVLSNLPTEESIKAFNEIKRAIGSLPLELPKSQTKNEVQIQEEQNVTKKQRVKTVILPDGTYGTQIVTEDESYQQSETDSKLRELLVSSTFLAPPLCRTILKLLISLTEIEGGSFNKWATQALMIFCALARFYRTNMTRVDQDALEKVHYAIRLLTNPGDPLDNIQQYLQQTSYQLLQDSPIKQLNKQQSSVQSTIQAKELVVKQPDDLIVYRQLKQDTGLYDIDLGDEEINEGIFYNLQDENSFVHKLSHLVQLTGYSDPIYAEAFVNTHKYDIVFEVLLANRSTKMVQNVQVEFRTAGEAKVLEKPQSVTLQPNQTARVRTSIKFSSADLGLIHGAIHYENNAGVEQAYLVTKEINIDMMDFIQSAEIRISEFRKKWSKYEWENRISINTNINQLKAFVLHIEKTLKMKRVAEQQNSEETCYICANLYGRTKLDDDFLINISADQTDEKINGFIRIRSKVKGIVVNLGERVKSVQQNIEL